MFTPRLPLLQGFVSLGQSPARTRERGADGCLLDLQNFCDLVVIQSFRLEQEGLPVAFTERIEGPSRERGFACALRSDLDLLGDLLFPLALFRGEDLQVLPLPDRLACFVAHQVGRHREEPRSLVPDGVLPERAHERFLRHFFSPVPVAEPPREIAHESLVVLAKEAVDVDGHGVLPPVLHERRERRRIQS
jgi:hypothetical protein